MGRRGSTAAAGVLGAAARFLQPLGLLLLLLGVCCSGGSSSHSLRHLLTAVSEPGPGLPYFLVVDYVNDQPILRYDSDNRTAWPQVPWMVTAEDAQFWAWRTRIAQEDEQQQRKELARLRDDYNQSSEEFHVLLWMYGCDLNQGAFDRQSYDGQDYMSYDRKTHTWTVTDPRAQVTAAMWDAELNNTQQFIEETCPALLRKYLHYGKETLLRKELPKVTVARKEGNDSQETLICRAHGFYPKEIKASWTKRWQMWEQETFHGRVAPNSDGTYHLWLSVNIDPKERDLYRCRMEYDEGLLEPLEVPWKDPEKRQDGHNATPSSSSHSLSYLLTAVSESGPGLPYFLAVGYVDGQPFQRYDSNNRTTQSQVPWMAKAENARYWSGETEAGQYDEEHQGKELARLRDDYNSSAEEFHVLQWRYGCDLSQRAYDQLAYDGQDHISYDKETLSWTANNPRAVAAAKRCNVDLITNKHLKLFMEDMCVERLQKYLYFGKETLLRTELPKVTVTRKEGDNSRETLVCRINGFYPTEISATWRKFGEREAQETFRGKVAPNSDGTYHLSLSVDIEPKEREHFTCHVEHASLLKPLNVAWNDPANNERSGSV